MKKQYGQWRQTTIRWGVLLTIALLTLLPIIFGCSDNALENLSDDDSFEAKLEEARIALDDADYDRAVELLENLNSDHAGNEMVIQYLSNAYAGLGGLDTYDFLSTIDILDDEGRSGSIDMIGKVLGDVDGSLTETEVADKLGYMDQAIEVLEKADENEGMATTLSSHISGDDRTVQRGLLGLARIVLLIGDMIIDQLGIDVVVLTEDGIQVLYAGEEPDFNGIYNSIIADKMADDIFAISAAIETIEALSGSDNDLYQDFEVFLNDLDEDGNRRISQAELESYLAEIINA